MCSSNLDSRRFRFTLATLCSSQYLKELFISCFLSLSIFPPVSPLESGCKGKACFSFSKLFKLFFQTFFPPPRLTSLPRALSLESGCKDKAMIPPFPNFFTVFFIFFFKITTKTVNGKRLWRKLFHDLPSRGTANTPRDTGIEPADNGKNNRQVSISPRA